MNRSEQKNSNFFKSGENGNNRDILNLDVDNLVKRLNDLSELSREKATGKSLVLVLGNTGAGKSTFVNYLAGCKMKIRDENALELTYDAENPIMEIGHGSSSFTNEPQLYFDRNTGLTYCDCPGFFDNRGAEFDIANSYAIKSMLTHARSVKAIVLLINEHSLRADRARGLQDASNILAQLLGIDNNSLSEDIRNSLIILVTRGNFSNTTEEIRSFVTKGVDGGRFQFLDQLISRIWQYDPQDLPENIEAAGAIARQDIIQHLKECQGLHDHATRLYGFGLSHGSLEVLNRLVTYLEINIRRQFENKNFIAVDKLLITLDSLKVLPSSEIIKANINIAKMIRDQITALQGENENLPVLKDISNYLKNFKNEAEASIMVVENRIEMQRALEEERKRKEELQMAAENQRDEAVAKANEAKAHVEQAEKKHVVATQNYEILKKEAIAKEEELKRLQQQVVVKEIHHHHHPAGNPCSIL